MAVNDLRERVTSITEALGDRDLIWFGIRAQDAESLKLIPQFRHSFGVTAPQTGAALETSLTMEELTGVRVDLDQYDIDLDPAPEVGVLRRAVMAAMNRPSFVATYRPSHFLSDIGFAMNRTVTPLGLFKDRQQAFEYKPWVETELARQGVRTLEWRYVAEEHRRGLVRDLRHGPIVLRPSRSSGGMGIVLVETPEQLDARWPRQSDHLVGAARFLRGAVPVNVGGVVFGDGTTMLHPASVQLIGIAACTDRRFGYCGNDFPAVRSLSDSVLDEIESSTLTIGRWLFSQGYLGAFGVDFLVDDDCVYFGEINARMQGSTSLGCALARSAGRSDLLLDHVAAFLGMDAGESWGLRTWSREVDDASQVIVHQNAAVPARMASMAFHSAEDADDARFELLVEPGTAISPGGVVSRIVLPRSVTRSGYEIDEQAGRLVALVTEGLQKLPDSRGETNVQSRG